jgi:type II secretion system protein G
MRKNKKTSGFTLIELLVVIAIIALLSSVVMTSMASTRMKGRNATRMTSLKTIQTALELYFTNNNAYPTTGGAWWGVCVNGLSKTTSGATAYIPGLTPTYISKLPTDPINDLTLWHGYIYRSDGINYKLLSIYSPEGTLNPSSPLSDPVRITYAWQVSSSPAVRSTW